MELKLQVLPWDVTAYRLLNRYRTLRKIVVPSNSWLRLGLLDLEDEGTTTT
jgi:hypothetical protein